MTMPSPNTEENLFTLAKNNNRENVPLLTRNSRIFHVVLGVWQSAALIRYSAPSKIRKEFSSRFNISAMSLGIMCILVDR